MQWTTVTHLRQAFTQAAKLPMLYLTIGTLLFALKSIDELFTLTNYKFIYAITDRLGNLFFAVAALTFIYKLTIIILNQWEKHVLNQENIVRLLISSLRKGLYIIFLLFFINIVIRLLELSAIYLTLANNITNTIIIVAIGWIAIQVVYAIEAVIYQQYKHTNKQSKSVNALYTKTRILRNIATVVIVLITIATILMSFSSVRNIGVSLLASAGFLTAIVGLAMQKTLSSLFSGLQIALSQHIKIGDVVVIENQNGIIEEISFTYVIVKCSDRRRLIIPISQFIEKPFENWSHDSDCLQSSVYLNLDYRVPVDPLRQHFETILKQSHHWNGHTSKCTVSELGERSIQLRLQASAANADALSDLMAEIREKMLAFLQEHYPHYLEFNTTP